MKYSTMFLPRRRLQAILDFAITLMLWAYFTVGFVVFFSPFYLLACVFSRKREQSFQRLNSKFYKGFFTLVRVMMPGHRWHIQPEVGQIRSSVVVCNHRSYLDSILLISLFEKHTTIVKSRLFEIPFFGRMLQWSGYIPSSAEGRFAEMMIRRIEGMEAFLAGGGNLIIFPEGTRSRNGALGRFNKGAFKIARNCRVPISVLCIRNTDRMFRRGSFSFDTRGPNIISLKLIGRVDAAEVSDAGSLSDVMTQVRDMIESTQNSGDAA